MAKRMLIDANHPEETRVVVLSGKRIEEFDYETAARSQLKGNIYLAKITRVEPSLQAAFVEYGGNRHGFLPFSEIHPDYYKIPIADREALAAEEAALRGDALGEEDLEAEASDEETPGEAAEGAPQNQDGDATGPSDAPPDGNGADPQASEIEQVDVEVRVDTVGGDEIDEQRRRRANLMRRYKIQEVIKRRQVILVQVSKEERGTKGAALTTYLSLAGRYCVLMPNTARGGGISRKIGSANDRRRLKSILSELKIPDGMAVIVRTAGAQRSKAEIRRDYEYLMRLWDEIRKTTLQSTAPCLIHEEANLIKRSIRDLYSRDMDEVWVEGEDGYKAAKAFMRSLMPSHAKKVQQYKDQRSPIFHHYQVEDQLEAMHSATVQLKSGGYIVLNQTEALVAIDVNSGRATRERHIEETALKTNLEAAEEVARQLRLRDLAGLIVVDFIDMEESRHNREVERRLKEAMRSDRARIQLGRISPFGLLELSRQRLRPSLFESSTDTCPRCGGSGHVRSIYSSAVAVLRAVEEEGVRRRGGDIGVTVPTAVALYILNEFRTRLVDVEQRFGLKVTITADDALRSDDYRLEREGAATSPAAEAADEEESGRKRRRGRRHRKAGEEESTEEARQVEADAKVEDGEAEDREEAREAAGEGDDGKKGRRRRGRRGGRRRSRRRSDAQDGASPEAVAQPRSAGTEESGTKEDAGPEDKSAEQPRAKRRGRSRRGRAKSPASDETTAAPENGAGQQVESTASPSNGPGDIESEAASAPAGRSRHGRSHGERSDVRPLSSQPRTDQPNTADEPSSAAVHGTNAHPTWEAGAEAGAGEPRQGAAPERSEPSAQPAAAAQESNLQGPAARESNAQGPDAGDDDDLPKRRGWWQRWV
jgi:ribonuclease E